MSGDLMHKGMTELTPVVLGTLTEDDIIPVYQKRTLTVNKISIKDFVAELIRLTNIPVVEEKAEDVPAKTKRLPKKCEPCYADGKTPSKEECKECKAKAKAKKENK